MLAAVGLLAISVDLAATGSPSQFTKGMAIGLAGGVAMVLAMAPLPKLPRATRLVVGMAGCLLQLAFVVLFVK